MKKFNVRVYVLRAIVEVVVEADHVDDAEEAVNALFGDAGGHVIDAVEVDEP